MRLGQLRTVGGSSERHRGWNAARVYSYLEYSTVRYGTSTVPIIHYRIELCTVPYDTFLQDLEEQKRTKYKINGTYRYSTRTINRTILIDSPCPIYTVDASRVRMRDSIVTRYRVTPEQPTQAAGLSRAYIICYDAAVLRSVTSVRMTSRIAPRLACAIRDRWQYRACSLVTTALVACSLTTRDCESFYRQGNGKLRC